MRSRHVFRTASQPRTPARRRPSRRIAVGPVDADLAQRLRWWRWRRRRAGRAGAADRAIADPVAESDPGAHTSAHTSADSCTDAGTDAGTYTGTYTGADSRAHAGSDSGTHTGADSCAHAGSDPGTHAGSDSGPHPGADPWSDPGADACPDTATGRCGCHAPGVPAVPDPRHSGQWSHEGRLEREPGPALAAGFEG